MEFAYYEGLANAQPTMKEIIVDPSLEIKKGQIVWVNKEGEINQSDSTYFYGVAAEDHSGKEDPLNSRANSDKLKIIDGTNAVFKLKVPTVIMNGDSTEDTYKSDSDHIPDGTNTACRFLLVLAKKGNESTNTDAIGTVKVCSGNYQGGDGYDLTIANPSCVPCDGDNYYFLAGDGAVNVSTDDGITAKYSDKAEDFIVVGTDTELGGDGPCIYVKAANHLYNGIPLE